MVKDDWYLYDFNGFCCVCVYNYLKNLLEIIDVLLGDIGKNK